jgi:hypothetical protein
MSAGLAGSSDLDLGEKMRIEKLIHGKVDEG